MQKKESVANKENHVKFGSNSQNAKAARKQFQRSDPQAEDKPVANESTLKFAGQKFGVETAATAAAEKQWANKHH